MRVVKQVFSRILPAVGFTGLLVASLLTIQIAYVPQKAAAINPPRCKVQTFGASSTTWGSCKDVSVPGFTFEEDKCYIVTLGNPSTAVESGCSAPKCNVNILGLPGGVGTCPDLTSLGATALPGRCYNINATGVEEVPCNNTPFNEGIEPVAGGGGGGGGGSPGSGDPSSATPGDAAAAQENFDSEAPGCDYSKPLTEVEKQAGCVERQGGFEEVDDSCNVGNAGRDCSITDQLSTIANVLSVGVGVIVVIMIIVGGIQYTTAGGDPQKVAAAKSKILNAIIALIAYFFLFAFLQWVVPGGLFN